jgi:hypothetical protein
MHYCHNDDVYLNTTKHGKKNSNENLLLNYDNRYYIFDKGTDNEIRNNIRNMDIRSTNIRNTDIRSMDIRNTNIRNSDIRYPDINNTRSEFNMSFDMGDDNDYNNYNLYNNYNDRYFQFYKINNSMYNNTCINVLSPVDILKNSNMDKYSYSYSPNFLLFFICSLIIVNIYLFLIMIFIARYEAQARQSPKEYNSIP